MSHLNGRGKIPISGWAIIGLVCALMAWLMASAHAGPFQEAQAFGHAQMNRATSSARAQPTNASVPGFSTANPSQTSLYGNPAALSNAGSTAVTQDKTGAGVFIQHSAATRPQFNITAKDPLIQGAQSIQKNAQAIAGVNPGATGACRNVTTTTPDTYGTFTCTKSRSVTTNTCDRVLTVTARTRPFCAIGTPLASTTISGITVPYQYGWYSGHITFQAICSAPGQATRIKVSGSDALGNCDWFKWYRNLGHFFTRAQPWATGWKNIGSIYYVGWSGYFYCFAAPPILMKSNGCNGNRCSVKFRVNMGTTHTACSDGGPGASYRYRRGRQWRTGNCCGSVMWGSMCQPRCSRWGYGWHRQGRWWRYGRYCIQPVQAVQVPDYRYATLKFTRNHDAVTFRDQWVNQPCR